MSGRWRHVRQAELGRVFILGGRVRLTARHSGVIRQKTLGGHRASVALPTTTARQSSPSEQTKSHSNCERCFFFFLKLPANFAALTPIFTSPKLSLTLRQSQSALLTAFVRMMSKRMSKIWRRPSIPHSSAIVDRCTARPGRIHAHTRRVHASFAHDLDSVCAADLQIRARAASPRQLAAPLSRWPRGSWLILCAYTRTCVRVTTQWGCADPAYAWPHAQAAVDHAMMHPSVRSCRLFLVTLASFSHSLYSRGFYMFYMY